jgi:zinc D-Ala-D-Ala dipeptidase
VTAPSASGLSLPIEQVPGHPDYVALASIAGVDVDLRYASPNNLLGRDLYAGLDCAWLHREAAAGLARAVAWLAVQRPGWRVRVLDALRPQRVQEAFWRVVSGTPMQAYFAHPERGSIHSFGMAVDVCLLDGAGAELDMGSGFDDTHEASHPEFEARLLASGALSAAHIAHRQLLRAAMAEGGFRGIATEWWHFDCGDPQRVRAGFVRVS